MFTKYFCALISGATLLAIVSGTSYAQTSSASRIAEITLYDGARFNGQSITIRAGEDGSNLVRLGFNDRTTSMRVTGNWEACRDINFGGECTRYSSDTVLYGPLDNQISSVRLLVPNTPTRPTVPGGGSQPVDAPRTGLRLFDGPGFFGQRYDAATDVSDLNRTGFNDRAESLAMARGEVWEVCMDSNYRSQCRTFSEPVANLGDYNFGNTISSMRRLRGGPTTPQRPVVPGGGFNAQISGETRGEAGVGFFAIPRANGSAVDHCERSSGRACGDTGADAICRMSGYREAVYYTVANARQYGGTRHISDGAQCRGGNCGAVINLLCTSN